MSEPSKTNATINSTLGTIQENVGYALGSKTMEAEGRARKAEANVEYEKAKSEGYAEGFINKMKGQIKESVGSVVGSEKMKTEGSADKAKGEAQKAINS